jgi:Ca2+-binding RTX toxin-like protein
MSLIETLETRKLMSASPIAYMDKGFLNVVGTPGEDNIVVRMDSNNPDKVVVLQKTMRQSGYGYDVKTLLGVHKSAVQRIRVILGAGDDSATIYDSVKINATIFCGPGDDSGFGGGGNDIVWGGDGNDSIGGKSGNDQCFGERGSDTISGGDGNDNLVGGLGRDTFYGGAGNDFIDSADGTRNDSIYAGTGFDTCKADKTDTLLEFQTRLKAEVEKVL